MIYYGDECAMDGSVDPDNRRAMDWEAAKGDLTRWIGTLGHYRRRPVWRRGTCTALQTDGRVLAFRRELGDERFVVVLNFGTGSYRIASDGLVLDFGEAEESSGTFVVPARSLAIFRRD
jgi:glycosidase